MPNIDWRSLTSEVATSYYLFGTDIPPQDFSSRVRPTGSQTVALTVSGAGFYAAGGPGEFARPAVSESVQHFFENRIVGADAIADAASHGIAANDLKAYLVKLYPAVTNGRYSPAQIKLAIWGQTEVTRQLTVHLIPTDRIGFEYQQKDKASGANYGWLTYVYNSLSFHTNTNAIFDMSGPASEWHIENLRFEVQDDDFDFESNPGNEFFVRQLEALVDLWGIGESVRLIYDVGSVLYSSYERGAYNADRASIDGETYNPAVGTATASATILFGVVPDLNRVGGVADRTIRYGARLGGRIDASAAFSTIVGGPGSDLLYGSIPGLPIDQAFYGGGGADTYFGIGAGDTVHIDSHDVSIHSEYSGIAFGGARVLRREPNQAPGANIVVFRNIWQNSTTSVIQNDGWIYKYERQTDTLRIAREGWSEEIVISNYHPGDVGIRLEGEGNTPIQPPFCFAAGTPILMADGSRRPIERVGVGDRVLAFDPTEQGGRGELREKRVARVFVRESTDVVELNGAVRVTLGHLFYTADGQFKRLADLRLGDRLVSERGTDVPIASIRPIENPITVYNFEVEDLHTYVAAGYRVHNESIQKFDEVITNGVVTSITLVHHQDDGTIHIWRLQDGAIDSELRLANGMVLRRQGSFASLPTNIKDMFSDADGTIVIDDQDDTADEAKHILRTDNFEDLTLDEVSADGLSRIAQAGEVGRRFGAQLGAIINLENPFLDDVFDAVLRVAGENLGEVIAAGGVVAHLPVSDVNVLDGLPQELINEIIDGSQGRISNYLSERLIVSIGIEGFAGELLEGLSQDTINALIDAGQQILNNVIDGRPDTDAYYGIDFDALKTQLRARLETELTAELTSLLSESGIDSEIANFISTLVTPLANAIVDSALDLFVPDDDKVDQSLVDALRPDAILANISNAAKAFLSSALTKAVTEGLGFTGDDIGDQFGRVLSTKIIDNVIGAIFDDGTVLFDANGLRWDTVFAGVKDLSSKFIASALVSELGLKGPEAEFATALANQVIGNVIQGGFSNAFNGVSWQAVGYALLQVVSAEVHADMMDDLIKNQGGAIGAEIGSVIGTFVGYYFGYPELGGAIGEIIGAIVGNWFGKTPETGAQLVYDARTGDFIVGSSWKQGGAERRVAQSIARHAASAMNGVLDTVGGSLLNANQITPGHYGMRKDYYTYREAGRSDTRARFNDLSQLISFGALNALEEAQIGGGDIYVKRAFYNSMDSLRSFDNGEKVHGSESSGFEVVGNDLDVLIGDLAAGADYSRYANDPTVINALVSAESDSFFAAGWAVTLQRAIELQLYKRHAADWYGGWALFMDEKADGKIDGKAYVPANLSPELDPETSERLIWIRDAEGNWTRAIRDTIDTLSKDVIVGSAGNDSITVTGDIAALLAGWTLNGAATNAGDHAIKVTALLDGGAGNDTIRGGDLGNDLLGGEGNDILIGGKLDDWLLGGAGADKLFAGAVSDPNAAEAALIGVQGGNGDYLDGGDGHDALYGSSGSDWLKGGAGEDRIVAGGGGDILEGGVGNDGGTTGVASLLGGEGSDQYVFNRGDGHDVIFDVTDPAAQVGVGLYGARAQYLAYTNFIPADGDPRNWAGNGAYEVNGSVKGGEDAITFGAGISIRDLIMRRSASGNDLIIELRNGPPGDVLTLKDWFDETRRVEWLRFADGQDIRIADISSFVIGTDAEDVILGTFGADFVVGNGGNDTLHLLPGNDFGFGDAGNDLVTGDEDNDWVLGGDGADLVMGGIGNDTVFGDGGNDQVYGGDGSDIISGGRGNDVVVTGAGDDLVRYMRGDGRDVLFDEFSNAWELVLIGTAPTNGYTASANGDIEKGGATYRKNGEWIGQYKWDSATGRLYRHVPTGAVTINGSGTTAGDILEFGIGIDMNDVQVRRIGSDLQLAIGASDSDATAFSAIADAITLKDWFSIGAQIEKFVFIETGTIHTSVWEIGAATTDGDDAVTGHATRQNWITGGLGDDRISGGATYDILFGNAGNDILDGGPGSDFLFGGGSRDTADRLFGGEGFDYASYASAAEGVKVSLANPNHNYGAARKDQFDSIEAVEGSNFDDRITGDTNTNWLRGIGGNDLLRGHLGDDVYEIGRNEGNDRIEDGNVGFEDIRRPDGTLAPGYSYTYNYVYVQEQGYYTLYHYVLKIWRTGTGELIFENKPGQNMIGSSPNESPPWHDPSWVTESYREGYYANGEYGLQWVREVMAGTEDGGRDTILFDAGISLSDLTVAWENSNQDLRISIAGGGSTLLASQSLSYRAIEEIQLADGLIAELGNLQLATATIGSAAADLFLAGADSQTFAGGDNNDVISGGAGNDTLSGDNGDDVLEGGAGLDTLSGGAGSDTVRYAGSTTAVHVDVSAAQVFVRTGATNTTTVEDNISGIENVVGSDVAGGDDLRGDDNANRLAGLGGADLIYGLGGDDTLIGGDDVDMIDGGAGNDGISGDEGGDTLRGQDGDDQIAGGTGDDTIEGAAGADFIDGGAGNDDAKGGADNDSMFGGDGDDTLYGGVNAAVASGNDILDGGAGNDLLSGEDGKDILIGGAGDDDLLGGGGDDTYAFEQGSGVDEIVDSAGFNTISLKGVDHANLWLTRVNNDLRIGVIGASDVIWVREFYTTTQIQAIYTATHAIYPASANALITQMTAAGDPNTTPAAMSQAIAETLAAHWHEGGLAPQGATTSTAPANEGATLTGQVVASDPDNTALSYGVAGAPAHGVLTLNAESGAWQFRPDDDYSGLDAFDIRITDASGKSSIHHVDLTIAGDNDAPTALILSNAVTTIAENTSTAARIKVADLSVTDDGLGSNAYALAGADAASFEVDGDALYLKAGVPLNFEAKATYSVTVVADDAEVGPTPDVSQAFTLNVSNENDAPAFSFLNTTTTIAEDASTAARIKVADIEVADDALGTATLALTGADASSFEIEGEGLYLKAGVTLNYEAKSSYAVTVTVDDPTVGATPDLSQSFTLNVSDVNEAPTGVTFANTTTAIAENASTATRTKVADLVIVDDALGTEAFDLTGADAASFEIIGSTLYLKAGVTLNVAAKASYSVTVTADDATVGAAPDASQSFMLNVVPNVNEAPTGLSFANTTTAIAESASTATRIKVADLVVTDDALGTEVFALAGADAASFEVIGSTLYLKAGVALNHEAKASYSVTVTADDTTVGATPDASRSLTLNVFDVNEAPTAVSFVNTTTSIAENSSTATRTKVADLVVADDALGSESFGLSGADAASFEIVGSTLYLKAGVALSYEAKSSYSVNVTVDDPAVGGAPDISQAFSLTITDVNEAPASLSLTNTTTSLVESTSTAARIKVADLAIADDALGSETIALNGADAPSFEIYNGALYLKAGVALNYEAKASYAVTVTVDDPTVGATPDLSQSFTLSITDFNEAPSAVSFANTTAAIAENTPTGSRIKVADIVVADDALGAETLSLSGVDAASFEIDGGVLYLKAGVALNREAKSAYSVTVNVNDASVGATPDAAQNFTLAVSDVNEPVSLNWAGSSAQVTGAVWTASTHTLAVPETIATGATIGRIAASDPDVGAFANFRFELTGANAGLFTINAVTGDIALAAPLNYEAAAHTFSVGITVWDGGAVGAGLSASGTFTIDALNVNEAPVGAGFSYYYAGARSAGTTVGTATASDPEGSAVTYAIHAVSRETNYAGEITTTSLAASTYTITAAGVVKLNANVGVVGGRIHVDAITIRLSDAQGNVSYVNAQALYDGSGGGGGGGGGGVEPPVVLDLNGDGVSLVPLAQSTVEMDVNADGVTDRIGWIGADDGFLALDRNGDGAIAGLQEISFVHDLEGAFSDLEGLRAYDTNGNGFLEAGDARFAEFRVWQDANQDGVAQAAEVTDLAERQIAAIGLTLTPTGESPIGAVDNTLYATATYIRTDGTHGTVGDVFLRYVPGGDDTPRGLRFLTPDPTGDIKTPRAAETDPSAGGDDTPGGLRCLTPGPDGEIKTSSGGQSDPFGLGNVQNFFELLEAYREGLIPRGQFGARNLLGLFGDRGDQEEAGEDSIEWCGTTPDKTPDQSSGDGLGDPSLGVAGEGIGDVDRTAQGDGSQRQSASGSGADPLGWISANELPLSAADPAAWIAELAEASRRVVRENRLSGVQPPLSDTEAQADDPADELFGVDTAASASQLHRRLGLADRRVLHMIDAMAGFEATSASDLARSSRQRDPKVAAMLTALPDIR